MIIDAKGLGFRELNEKVRKAVGRGAKTLTLKNVNGQRYIGVGLREKVRIEVQGVPGNDMAAFMDGPQITVRGNAQDAVGNTMNSGEVTVHGSAGDVIGYGMRGGRIYVRGDVGYRIGIHMKSYKDNVPVIVVGGTARDFLGEYMAGGIIIVLGLDADKPLAGEYIGTGMHGGRIYLRGKVKDYQLGMEVKAEKAGKKDLDELRPHILEFCRKFKLDEKRVLGEDFTVLAPHSHRPYSRVYSY
ncbi:MAG: hypothetical protein V1921_03235 [Candidatus Altiarchaeota archaeon]